MPFSESHILSSVENLEKEATELAGCSGRRENEIRPSNKRVSTEIFNWDFFILLGR